MLTAIIVAGGSSSRMGFDKTFALLGDRPIIAHTVAAFEATSSVQHIIVVGRVDRVPELRELIAQQQFKKVRHVIPGGIRRQDSVSNGLKGMPQTDYVSIHDAARPLVLPSQIEQVFASARIHGAAALAAPVIDTLKRADAEGIVSGSVDRDGLYAMQTPQIFSRELLLSAYARIVDEKLSITDEVSAIERFGGNVALVTNNDPNFKITFPSDLALAELVLRLRDLPDR